ncbi:MAG: hypothetical protein ABWZ86_07185, partial [Hyphomicrobium sp.]
LKSVQAGLDWSALAGNQLGAVVDYELHKRISTKTLTRASLDRILALNDRAAIIKIASVPPEARDMLFTLKSDSLNSLLRSLSEDELKALAGYLSGLKPEPREKVLEAVAAEPAKMQILASHRVRDRIINSNDQSAAVDMMLAPPAGFSTGVVLKDVRLVWDGRVAPLLLWDKHPQAVGIAGFLALVLLFWLGRLFRPRRISGPQVGST